MITEKIRVEYLLMILISLVISLIILNLLNLDSHLSLFSSLFTIIIISLEVYMFIYKKQLFSKVKKSILDYLTYFENFWVAVLFSLVLIIIVNLVSKTIWSYIFAILLAYLIAEFISSFLIRGGKGIVQFPTGGTATQHHGHAYLVFIVSIVIGTLLSGVLSNVIINYINTLTGWSLIILSNLIIIGVIALNFYTLFLRR